MKPTENSGSTTPGPIVLAGEAAGGVWVCAWGGEEEKVYTGVSWLDNFPVGLECLVPG